MVQRINDDNYVADMVAKIKHGEFNPLRNKPEVTVQIGEYFNSSQSGIQDLKDTFKTDIQQIHTKGLNGRTINPNNTLILKEKTPEGDTIYKYRDNDGKVVYEKRVAHDGSSEKVTYYGADEKPTNGYHVYSENGISGFRALEYKNGKEEVLWQTR